jgi:hypothetical protein
MAVDIGSVMMSISLSAFSGINIGLDFGMIMKRTHRMWVRPFCDKVHFEGKWGKP